jgi:LDH2 family malate/lactate/ureidoglycolate dehydrogenase
MHQATRIVSIVVPLAVVLVACSENSTPANPSEIPTVAEALPTGGMVAQRARRLLPLGGSRESGSHKGYGLGILVEILCGVLTGTVTALNANQEPRGHFFGAINPAAFRPAAEFKADMDRLIRELKSTPPVEGESRVYVAGEIEFETAEERSERGIPLHGSVLKGLRDVGAQLGVPYDLE